MHATESTDDVFTYRPRTLTVAWRPASQEHADALRDSLEWRYGPRCAVEAHWGREMSYAMHRQERLKVLEMQCEDRAVDCPVEERRAVAEQAKIWGQCRQRAKRDYVFAQRELKAMIEQREILEASESWPGYLRGLRADKRAQRAAAEARMAEPGHDRASDPDPDNPVFLDPEGCAFLHGIDAPHGGFEAAGRVLEPCGSEAAFDDTNEPGGAFRDAAETLFQRDTNEPESRPATTQPPDSAPESSDPDPAPLTRH